MTYKSSTYGTFTLTTKTLDDAKAIFVAFADHLSNADYYTEFQYDMDEDCILDYEEDENANIKSWIDFGGAGRWSYSVNCDNLGKWLNNDAVATKLPWNLNIEYMDYEPNIQYLVKETYKINHKVNQPLDEIQSVLINQVKYDYNPYSLFTHIEGMTAEKTLNLFHLNQEFIGDYFSSYDEYLSNKITFLDDSIMTCMRERNVSKFEAMVIVLDVLPCLKDKDILFDVDTQKFVGKDTVNEWYLECKDEYPNLEMTFKQFLDYRIKINDLIGIATL